MDSMCFFIFVIGVIESIVFIKYHSIQYRCKSFAKWSTYNSYWNKMLLISIITNFLTCKSVDVTGDFFMKIG